MCRRPETPPSDKAPVRTIISEAAHVFGVSETDIIGLSRKQHLVRARQAVCRVAYDHGWTNREIGNRLSGRDPTTITHARNVADIYVARDPNFRSGLARLRRHADGMRGKGYGGASCR